MYPGPDCLYTDERAAAVALARPRSRPTCPNRKLVQKKIFFLFKNTKNSRPRKI